MSRKLTSNDVADVSQDVFLWLLRNQYQVGLISDSWLSAVTGNFVMRHLRARAVRREREGEAARIAATLQRRSPERLFNKIFLDSAESSLSGQEATVLRHVRKGYDFTTACAIVGVPRGSASSLKRRLLAHIAHKLHSGARNGRSI